MIAYEQLLDRNLDWALREGSMHFEKESAVHKSLRSITKRLNELGIPYALVGAMAMFFNGYRRFTDDIDMLVTLEGLQELHRQLEGLGYVPPFPGSKQLRDTDTGVRIEFLVTGGYPGDGKPKAISFPDPAEVSVEIDGVRCLQLPKVVELKLASGMTGAGRLSDLCDVEKMIRILNLPEALADQLHPSVREKYKELWQAVKNSPPEP